MIDLRRYFLPYLASNVIALGLLFVARHWPRSAQLACATIFLWAAIINATTAMMKPQVYLEYATLTPVPAYARFITGWFALHIQDMVIAIALGQFAIAALLVQRRPWRVLGVVGAIIFLLAIAPLGVGSAFPFSLTFIAAIIVMDRRRRYHHTVLRADDRTDRAVEAF
jgi:hypothetical protein